MTLDLPNGEQYAPTRSLSLDSGSSSSQSFYLRPLLTLGLQCCPSATHYPRQSLKIPIYFSCSKSVFLLLWICCLVAQSCLTLCDPMDCSTPGFPLLCHLLELAQTHVHQVGEAIKPAHPLSSPSPPAFNLSQHQGLF